MFYLMTAYGLAPLYVCGFAILVAMSGYFALAMAAIAPHCLFPTGMVGGMDRWLVWAYGAVALLCARTAEVIWHWLP